MAGASIGSDLVARYFDGRSPMSMAGVMLAASLAAIAAYIVLAHPAELCTCTVPSALDQAKKEPHDVCCAPAEPALTFRDGVGLAHFEAGPAEVANPPLVFVNRWTGDHGIFSPQIEHFARQRRVV